MTKITVELDNINQNQLNALLEEHGLCINHLITREIKKLISEANQNERKLSVNKITNLTTLTEENCTVCNS